LWKRGDQVFAENADTEAAAKRHAGGVSLLCGATLLSRLAGAKGSAGMSDQEQFTIRQAEFFTSGWKRVRSIHNGWEWKLPSLENPM
jgi:hypothetical protein